MLSAPTKAAAGVTKDLAEHDINSDLKDVAHQAVHQVEDTLDKAATYANETGKKVRGVLDDTSDTLKTTTQNITTQIRNNPVQASVIALIAGFVIGSMLKR